MVIKFENIVGVFCMSLAVVVIWLLATDDNNDDDDADEDVEAADDASIYKYEAVSFTYMVRVPMTKE